MLVFRTSIGALCVDCSKIEKITIWPPFSDFLYGGAKMVVGLFSGVCFGLRPVCKYFSAKLKHELCLHFSTIVSQQAPLPSMNPQITHYSRTTKSHHEINTKVSKKRNQTE